MFAEIYDVNLSGPITLEVESPEELAEMLDRYEGTWHDYDGEGVALLSEPYGRVYAVEPDSEDGDPYPDWVVERDDEEGFLYYEA